MKQEITKRKSNFELLRIFAMFLIVISHFNRHGIYATYDFNSIIEKINLYISSMCYGCGKLGVMLFVMITGYFIINSKPKLSSFLRVYLQTWFYSVLFLILAYLFSAHPVKSHTLNVSLFPLCGNVYWFITTYLMLYIFTPFINIMIQNSQDKKYYLLIFSTLVLMFIPTFFGHEYAFCPFVYFIYFYIIGAYIGLGSFNFLNNNKKLKFFAIISLLLIAFDVLLDYTHSSINMLKISKYCDIISFPLLIIAIYLFNYFKDLKISYNKFINYISGSMFAVYLIHDNGIVHPFLWKRLLHVSTYINSKYFILYMFLICTGVFIFCIVADKILSKFYKKGIDFVTSCFEKIIAKFTKKESV